MSSQRPSSASRARRQQGDVAGGAGRGVVAGDAAAAGEVRALRRRRDQQHVERLAQHRAHGRERLGVERRLAAVHRGQVAVRLADEGEQLARGRRRC